MSMPPCLKWQKIKSVNGAKPTPRHGHRAIVFKDHIIFFAGGNERIIHDLFLFKTTTQNWHFPLVKGDIPLGRASYGIASDSTRIIIFGGMMEFACYSNQLYELNLHNWEWKHIETRNTNCLPEPRLGHTFTLVGNKIYMFGGLTSDSGVFKEFIPKYLNDLHVLNLKDNNPHNYRWEMPKTYGTPPCPRESHTAVAFTPMCGTSTKLLIYGGMCGKRLGDIWILDLDSMTWTNPIINGISPLPRSLHTATIINRKMYVFGGWISSNRDVSYKKGFSIQPKAYCSNTLAIFNLDKLVWEYVSENVINDENYPKPRAGHSAVKLSSRLYIWSGRDGNNKSDLKLQSCCDDLWCLETELPVAPQRTNLSNATTTSLDLRWASVLAADSYLVQIQKMDLVQENMIFLDSRLKRLKSSIQQSILNSKLLSKQDSSVSAASTDSQSNQSHTISNTSAKLDNNNVEQSTIPPSHMSGMEVLVAAATACPKLATTKYSTSQNIQILPSQTVQSSSIVQNVKMNETGKMPPIQASQSFRFVTPQTQANTKQIYVKTDNGNQTQSQLMTLLKTSQGTLTLTPSLSGSPIFKLVPQKLSVLSSKSSTISTQTVQSVVGQIPSPNVITSSNPVFLSSSNSAISSNSAVANPQLPLKMFVLPTSQAIQSGQQVSIRLQSSTQPNKTIKIPVSAIKSINHSNIQGGPSKLVLSSDGHNSYRIIPASSDTNNQRLVLLPSQSQVVTSTALVNSAPIASCDTSANSSEMKIPQFDGPDDESMASDCTDHTMDINYKWFDVGVFKTNNCLCDGYYIPRDSSVSYDDERDMSSLNADIDYSDFIRIPLVPSTPYKIRVCALNSLGHSPWGPVNAFKTLTPNLPPSPHSIKFDKTDNGVLLSWQISSRENLTFFVHIALKRSNVTHFSDYFCRVYEGTNNCCTIPTCILDQAYIDVHPKPHIIIRISAKSEKGYGPAVQIRWSPNM